MKLKITLVALLTLTSAYASEDCNLTGTIFIQGYDQYCIQKQKVIQVKSAEECIVIAGETGKSNFLGTIGSEERVVKMKYKLKSKDKSEKIKGVIEFEKEYEACHWSEFSPSI